MTWDIAYVSTLSIRPCEMMVLQQLSSSAKDKIMPCFLLAPWLSAHQLEAAIERVELAYPKRPYILDLEDNYFTRNETRQAVQEFEELKSPIDRYKNWCEFILEHEYIYPCIQTKYLKIEDIKIQIEKYKASNRKFCLRIKRQSEPYELDKLILELSHEFPENMVVILEGGWIEDALFLEA